MSENKEGMTTNKEKVLEWLNSSEAKAGKLEQEAKVLSYLKYRENVFEPLFRI